MKYPKWDRCLWCKYLHSKRCKIPACSERRWRWVEMPNKEKRSEELRRRFCRSDINFLWTLLQPEIFISLLILIHFYLIFAWNHLMIGDFQFSVTSCWFKWMKGKWSLQRQDSNSRPLGHELCALTTWPKAFFYW